MSHTGAPRETPAIQSPGFFLGIARRSRHGRANIQRLMPTKAGIHLPATGRTSRKMDSRLRGNDIAAPAG
jgi:hypothetical protein